MAAARLAAAAYCTHQPPGGSIAPPQDPAQCRKEAW